jgi:hypothetical protein
MTRSLIDDTVGSDVLGSDAVDRADRAVAGNADRADEFA